MNRCPLTYELCEEKKYSQNGLKLLGRTLHSLKEFPYSAKEQLLLASQLATKLSIQGIQPKLSIILNITKQSFEIVETNGKYILKPPHHIYDELPQNEDLTMRLASIVGIEIPLHGMIYNRDGSLSYFIKRFDRIAHNKKIGIEDFSQLLGFSRDTKYESSMEKVVSVIEKHCTFPMVEKVKLFRRILFNFLIGNEDMHLKNFSLIRRENKVELAPGYDFLNTTIVLKTKEEMALPMRGKKSRITYEDLFEYYGNQRLGIPKSVLEDEKSLFALKQFHWRELIEQSFLSKKMKEKYLFLLNDRWQRIAF